MSESVDPAGLRSMTGFGRSSFEVDDLAFEVEVRTVNHRHIDVRAKLPRLLANNESEVRARVPKQLRRGKVDLTVSLASGTAVDNELEIDEKVVEQYVSASRQLAENYQLAGQLDIATLMSMPGVTRFVDPGLDEEVLSRALLDAVDRALAAMVAMRVAEGSSLAAEFQQRLAHVKGLIESLESRSGLVKDAAKRRLRKRAEQLEVETGLLDDARLHQEIVIAADRMDIAEELTRLRSHVEQFESVIGSAGRDHPVGRRLDFLLQELGREANTIGSKANDATLAHDVVELKTELERIREQVQNIE